MYSTNIFSSLLETIVYDSESAFWAKEGVIDIRFARLELLIIIIKAVFISQASYPFTAEG